jgi:NAD(P)-dependent dehydrogenase (short-subunit alcohol dehydrogenase family)
VKLKNKYALITGGSQGLGKEIAKSYLLEGASIMICSRNEEELLKTKKELSTHLVNGQKILTMKANVAEKSQLDALFQKLFEEFPHLDILVNNAGIYGPMGYFEKNKLEDWEQTIQINLMGTVYACYCALPHFKERKSGTIINLSGGGATKPMPQISSYAASKAAVVRFTETLALEVKDLGITVNALAPGAMNTRLLDEVLEAGPENVGKEYFENSIKQKEGGGVPFDKGASLCVHLATDTSGVTGKLISAVWDPWERLSEYSNELDKTDIYTLRRIIPEDRGLDWEGS